MPDPNFFGGDLTITDHEGEKQHVEPWNHPFGVFNQDLDKPSPRANYRTAGLADMMQAVEQDRAARCGLDVALHAVEVMTSLLKAAESGSVVTLQTTCERPLALGPDQAQALLKA